MQNLFTIFVIIVSALLLMTVFMSIVPSVLASNNSGPGRSDDNREKEDDPVTMPSQDRSAVTTIITIPQDAESHSAANPYSPNPATVTSGSTVTWINTDDEDRHTATADDGSFSTGIINPGSSGRATVNAEAGAIISYRCDVHPEMRGILQISTASSAKNAVTNTTVSSNTMGFNNSAIISNKPFAIGHYSITSESLVNNTIQISVVGNTTITLPNSSETITTNDTGNVTVSLTKSMKGILSGKILLTTEDGNENATILVTEIFGSENSPGRGIALFSSNSTGKLAPLDGMVAVTIDEDQVDGSAKVSFFEWRGGPFEKTDDSSSAFNMQGNVSGNNQTTNSSVIPTPPTRQAQRNDIVQVSITPGASSKTNDAFSPSPVPASVGNTIRWTNDDSTPHTVTSGSGGQPDGKFDSSPNLTPLMASGQTFEHTFEQTGQYPYYCALHPNMVGTVNVS